MAKPRPHRLTQYAALPWRRDGGGRIEVMLITSRDTGRWVLPKGWPEGPEEFRDAAAREAKEEAGISGAVSRYELGHYSYLKCGANRDLPCDVLLTPHPEAFDRDKRLAALKRQPDTNPFVDPGACRAYAAGAGQRLDRRIAEESGGTPASQIPH